MGGSYIIGKKEMNTTHTLQVRGGLDGTIEGRC